MSSPNSVYTVRVLLPVTCCLWGSISALGARRASFLTIPHPCLFLFPLTKQSGVPSRRVENLAHRLHAVYDDGKGVAWK